MGVEITPVMSEEAMRIQDGTPVFVTDKGEYSEEFPEEHIVHRSDSEETKFRVYGFVGEHGDFEEQSWDFDNQDEAIEMATKIYGQTDVDKFSRSGEVFEVEVHEINK